MPSYQAETKPANITVVGSINCDLSAYVTSFPAINQTIHAQSSTLSVGGKGLNQAVAATKAGGQVNFIACVGSDSLGKMALEYLQANNINTEHIHVIDGKMTGTANIIVTDDGDNMIVVSPGANFCLKPEDIEQKRGIIRDSDIVVVQLEIPIDTVQSVLSIANELNIKTILNPAPANDSVEDLLGLSSFVTPNETELQALTGVATIANEKVDLSKITMAAEVLRNKGCGVVITTLGENGSLFSSKNHTKHVPAFSIETVDPTGAGDVFNGVLAVALAEGMAMEQACQLASAASAISVTKPTAGGAIPDRKEIEALLSSKATK